ncbi:MAG: cytochrome B [Bacteroidota bacterium]
MYNGLVHAHSGLRWIVLVLLILTIINSFAKKKSGVFTEKDRKLGLFTFIFSHVQLLLGLVLYFISPLVVFSASAMKNTVQRFYLVEHISLMLVAIILITLGYSKSKRASSDRKKFGIIGTYFLIALILILAAIPWPFRIPGAGWF